MWMACQVGPWHGDLACVGRGYPLLSGFYRSLAPIAQLPVINNTQTAGTEE